MTKVEHTRTHIRVAYRDEEMNLVKAANVLVTDAELVLVGKNQCDGCCAGKPIQGGRHRMGEGQYSDYMICKKSDYVKPILISRTEKIEVGDWFLNLTTKQISQCTSKEFNDFIHSKDKGNEVVNVINAAKILALPEHFSPEQLQMIVDGKLKEGKCLVECELMCPNKDGGCEHFDKTGEECSDLVSFIKLNSSNHVTIYSISELNESEISAYNNGYRDGSRDHTINSSYQDQLFKSLHKVEEKMYTKEEVRNYVYQIAFWSGDVTKSQVDFWFEQNVK